ncbi:MAG: DUF885 family protein [Bryobacterales bacterium]|nr:DUF885 family protein [Bryobacterales bacterium]
MIGILTIALSPSVGRMRLRSVEGNTDSKRWSRAQAVQYFVDTTGKPLAVAEGEIDRAIWDPASLVVYKAGELTFKRMKRESRCRSTCWKVSFELRTELLALQKNRTAPDTEPQPSGREKKSAECDLAPRPGSGKPLQTRTTPETEPQP